MTARRQGAEFSADRRYRYLLTRGVDLDLAAVRLPDGVTFIGLNPSRADENSDDPTIRRCIGFARSWGAPSLSVVNLSPLVATYPGDLKAAGPEPGDIVATNLEHVASVTVSGEMVVAAWGVLGALEGRDARMMEFLRGSGVRIVYCLALNADGSPRHPMYLPGDIEPVVYRGFGPVRPECGVSADTPIA